jgi:hypothetical protein
MQLASLIRAFEQIGFPGAAEVEPPPPAAIAEAKAAASANLPPPSPSVPTNSVSQKRHSALARSSSRPLQRLQPEKRQKTAGRPARRPSPCSV